jgi:hypothetical protein
VYIQVSSIVGIDDAVWLAKAQNTIVIQTVLTPPYPVYYGDFVKLTNLANIVVQNTDLQNSYTIRFRMELDGGNAINLTLPQSIIL